MGSVVVANGNVILTEDSVETLFVKPPANTVTGIGHITILDGLSR